MYWSRDSLTLSENHLLIFLSTFVNRDFLQKYAQYFDKRWLLDFVKYTGFIPFWLFEDSDSLTLFQTFVRVITPVIPEDCDDTLWMTLVSTRIVL